MQNAIILAPAQNVLAYAAQQLAIGPVVKNDSNEAAFPSIKINSIAAPAALHSDNTTLTAIAKLKAMEASRYSWETTELAASNKRLYSILLSAYSYYWIMKNDSSKDVRKEHGETLDTFIAERGYTFMPSTHDMTRVIKCVFGVDRRRVSAYSVALREALRQEVTPDDLVAFIEENGGVEQIRLGGTKPLSAKKRAEKVQAEVTNAELGVIKIDPKLYGGNAEWNDKQVVIVATYLPTGEFQVNAVVKHDSAVNAALAGYYSQKESKKRAEAKALRDQEAAEKQAAEQQKHEEKKAQEEATQKVEVEAERAEDARQLMQEAHFNSILEAVPA
jgi:hypothetical protein